MKKKATARTLVSPRSPKVAAAVSPGSQRAMRGRGLSRPAKPDTGKGSRKGSGKAPKAQGRGKTSAKKRPLAPELREPRVAPGQLGISPPQAMPVRERPSPDKNQAV